MLINTFSMQRNIITTLESHSVINFTIEKLNFSKLLINLIFFGYTYHWYSLLILVFNFHYIKLAISHSITIQHDTPNPGTI